MGVLLGDGGGDIPHRDPHLRHTVWSQPDAHGVIFGTKNLHIGGTGHALDGVQHVGGDVVADEQRVVAVIGRIDGRYRHEAGRAFGHRQALALHLLRQLTQHLVDAVVDIDSGDIEVGADIEGHADRHHAVTAGSGAHVEHFFHTVDGLLNRRGHRGL